ncbi:hypothetical protein ACVWXO_005678 [Bradyrhizobium sp. LM2.7]
MSDTLKFDLRDWLVASGAVADLFCVADHCHRDYSVVVRLK